MRRSLSTALAVLSVAATGAAALAATVVAPAAAAAPPASDPPGIVWQTCPNEAGFDCGTLAVPLDYDDPLGRTIEIAVIRHVATDPAHRLGSVFYNPGGPGGSGVSDLPLVYSRFPDQVRADFDLVSFDPRGVGASAGVSCFATPDEESALLSQAPIGFPVGPDEQPVWVDVYRQFGQACGANAGPVLAHMSTANVARDLDRLRQAVGDSSLNYFGISYGTYLGATYANLFPDRVRAMVLDANVDAAAWADQVTGAAFGTFLRIGSDTGAAQTLDEFVRECGQVDVSRCAFSAGSPQATATKLAALLARLRTGPIVVDGTSIPYAPVVTALVTGLYIVAPTPDLGRPGWVGLATILQILWTARSGAAVHSASAAATVRSVLRASAGGALGEPSFPGAQYGVLCSDSPNPRLPALYPLQEAFANARSGAPGSVWTWISEPCSTWPVPADPDRYLGPFNRPTAATVLLVGITHDPATPYQASVNLAHELARARLLTVDGGGHTALLNPSECAAAAEAAYFVDGTLPAVGTVCSQDGSAF